MRARKHERALLSFYLSELDKNGVSAPQFDHAWLRYRQSAIWGLVIGWLITPPQNYGVKITSANISRMAKAVADLECIDSITSTTRSESS